MWMRLLTIGVSVLTLTAAGADDQRFSALNQINEHTVSKLGLVWSKELGTSRGLEATPVVEDGIIYTTGSWSVVFAFDARTGKMKWTYDPKVPRERAYFFCCDVVNRGVALHNGKVYVGTLDGRLIALDQRTGAVVWSVQPRTRTRPTPSPPPHPRQGQGRDRQRRLRVRRPRLHHGLRRQTGKQAWRFYTVPGDPKRASNPRPWKTAAKTWNGKEWWKAGGGGAPWEGMSYDPDLDLLFFGTGNASTWYRALRGEGDSLYTASILAVKASTGELAWHFQTTPGDSFDYDATQPLIRPISPSAAGLRKVLLQANKNGFFYVLDRETGEFALRRAVRERHHLGERSRSKDGPSDRTLRGRPTRTRSFCHPSQTGPTTGTRWRIIRLPASSTLPARVGTQMVHVPDKKWKYDPNQQNVGIDGTYEGPLFGKMAAMPQPTGELLAWDPAAQKAAWRAKLPSSGGRGRAGHGRQPRSSRPGGRHLRRLSGDRWRAGLAVRRRHRHHGAPGHVHSGRIQYVTVMAGWGGPPG